MRRIRASTRVRERRRHPEMIVDSSQLPDARPSEPTELSDRPKTPNEQSLADTEVRQTRDGEAQGMTRAIFDCVYGQELIRSERARGGSHTNTTR